MTSQSPPREEEESPKCFLLQMFVVVVVSLVGVVSFYFAFPFHCFFEYVNTSLRQKYSFWHLYSLLCVFSIITNSYDCIWGYILLVELTHRYDRFAPPSIENLRKLRFFEILLTNHDLWKYFDRILAIRNTLKRL